MTRVSVKAIDHIDSPLTVIVEPYIGASRLAILHMNSPQTGQGLEIDLSSSLYYLLARDGDAAIGDAGRPGV